jgi:hypothetical protein
MTRFLDQATAIASADTSWAAGSVPVRLQGESSLKGKLATTIELVPLSDHGGCLLDRFEEATGARPYGVALAGARNYNLMAERMPIAFELALDAVDPNWTEHIDWAATNDAWE